MKIDRTKNTALHNRSRASLLRRALLAASRFAAAMFPVLPQNGDRSPSFSCSGGRTERLDEIRSAIRLGFFDEAEALIFGVGDGVLRDPDFLNLLGVIDEERHSWKTAARWYCRALRLDRAHNAAHQNMRRIYELRTFGWSDQRIRLGDERPLLNELLNSRAPDTIDRDEPTAPSGQVSTVEPTEVSRDGTCPIDSHH